MITKKSLANLKPAKKGEVRNPLGGKTHNPEIRKIKALTQQELVEVGSLVIKGSIEDLQRIAKDKKASALKCMLAAVAVRTIQKGDPTALDALLNRLVGKVKDYVEHSGSLPGASVIVHLPANGREATATDEKKEDKSK